jgi:hypothetical protein
MSVKKLLLLFVVIFCITDCFAQDTLRSKKNWLTDSVIERYNVLRADPAVKDGPYKAFFKRKTVIASGNYKNGRHTGVWQFFDQRGRLVEKYNYDKDKFTYIAPIYARDYLSYMLDDTLKKGDRVSRPLKIGGIYYGFIPYINIFQVPFDTFDVNTDAFEANIELLISPMGLLADYKVRLSSQFYEYDHIFNMDVHLLDDADRRFLPATLNGKPVMSRIIIKCVVNPNGKLDFD